MRDLNFHVFSDVIPCRKVNSYRRFGDTTLVNYLQVDTTQPPLIFRYSIILTSFRTNKCKIWFWHS